jgi:hypothetical protein
VGKGTTVPLPFTAPRCRWATGRTDTFRPIRFRTKHLPPHRTSVRTLASADIADGAPSGLIFAPQYDPRFASIFATNWTNNTRLWLRRKLTLSSVPAGGVVVVAYIEDNCRFFLNGVLQFSSPVNHNGGVGQTFLIPAGSLLVGDNFIAIECNDEAPAASASVVYADFILEVE